MPTPLLASVSVDNATWQPLLASVDAASYYVSCKDGVDGLKFKHNTLDTQYDRIEVGGKQPFADQGGYVKGSVIAYFQADTGAAVVVGTPVGTRA